MKILLITATEAEAKILIRNFNLKAVSNNMFSNDKIDLLLGGVGVHTSIFETTKYLSNNKPDLIINAGIAGAYKGKAKIEEVFAVKSDYFGDAGYYDNDSFINIFNSNFNNLYSDIFIGGKLYFSEEYYESFENISDVEAVTVNTAERFSPEENSVLESMEGAAIVMCAKLFSIKCLQIRAVSNIVNVTPKSDWKVKEAIKNYSQIITDFIKKIQQNKTN